MDPRNDLGRKIRHPILRSLRGTAMLVVGLLLVLPESALAEKEADPDPFDRSGFYVGGGATYQFNAFEGRVEDVIEDAVDDAIMGANASFDLEDSLGFNALLGYRVWSWFAVELQYEWIDEYDIDGSAVLPPSISGTLYSIEGHSLTASTKWIVPFWRLQPYILLGGGVAVSDVSRGNLAVALTALGAGIKDGTHVKPAARLGFGLDIYVTKHIVLNAQASAVLTTLKNPDIGDVDDLNYMSVAAGLQYRF